MDRKDLPERCPSCDAPQTEFRINYFRYGIHLAKSVMTDAVCLGCGHKLYEQHEFTEAPNSPSA